MIDIVWVGYRFGVVECDCEMETKRKREMQIKKWNRVEKISRLELHSLIRGVY